MGEKHSVWYVAGGHKAIDPKTLGKAWKFLFLLWIIQEIVPIVMIILSLFSTYSDQINSSFWIMWSAISIVIFALLCSVMLAKNQSEKRK